MFVFVYLRSSGSLVLPVPPIHMFHAGLILAWRQSEVGTGFGRRLKTLWIIGGSLECKSCRRANAGHRHYSVHIGGLAGSSSTLTIPAHLTVDKDLLASATARPGYSFIDHWLVYQGAAAPGLMKRRSNTLFARLTCRCRALTTNCWNSSIFLFARRRIRLERLPSLRGPERACPFSLVASELVSHPEQRAEDRGAVVAGQVHDAGFHDEAAEFDELPRALASLDLPRAHVMSRPCGLMTVARRSVAAECRPCCGQLSVHFAAPGFERTRSRA